MPRRSERAHAPSKWRVQQVDSQLVGELVRVTGLRREAAGVLAARGVTPDRAGPFLLPRLRDLRPPEGMSGLAEAAERLERAVRGRERVGIFGDYDVDGVTTAALLARFLLDHGLRPIVRVARRHDGYGFSADTARAFVNDGASLVITGDCGTSDHEAIARCREAGVDVIVVDHHQVPSAGSPAFALLNPHRPDSRFPFRGMCSAGISFYLAAATRTRLGSTTVDPRTLLDLAAVGTIGDSVPLLEENRILVARGLDRLRSAPSPGLAALLERGDLVGSALTPRDIAFRVTPRLNAPGRLGEARAALDLLLAETIDEARTLAAVCDEANRERQMVQEGVLREATVQAYADDGEFIVAAGPWHPGVVGIVAARIVERCGKPAAVVSVQDGVGRASVRAPAGFNLYEIVSQAAPLLLRYGGHAAACGFSVEAARLDELREALCDAVRRTAQVDSELVIDGELGLGQIDLELCEQIARLEPFGEGNPPPLLCARGVPVLSARPVGDGHVRLRLGDSLRSVSAVGFGMADRAPVDGNRLDVAFELRINDYRGVRRPDLVLADMRSAA